MMAVVFPGESGACSVLWDISGLSPAEIARGIVLHSLPERPADQDGCYAVLMGDRASGQVWWAQTPYAKDALEQAKEQGREEIRALVREADAKGEISGSARAELEEKGIIPKRA